VTFNTWSLSSVLPKRSWKRKRELKLGYIWVRWYHGELFDLFTYPADTIRKAAHGVDDTIKEHLTDISECSQPLLTGSRHLCDKREYEALPDF